MVGWQVLPDKWSEHEKHAHNRLLTSILLNSEERKAVADAHNEQLAKAKGPVAVLLPMHGLGEWDRPGGPLRDDEGLKTFLYAMESGLPGNVDKHVIDGHINDAIFAETALSIFDNWCSSGVIKQ